MKKALIRSLVIIVIIALSIGIGFVFEFVCDKYDKHSHPIKYSEFVDKYSAEYGVPKEIIYAVIKTESSFQSDAVSNRNAIGLMQITPDTFDWLMMKNKESLEQGMLYDPQTNIRYGTYFLSLLYNEFDLWDTVYAAYNAGMRRIKDWLADEEYSKDGVLVNIPFEETRKYVIKVNKAADIYKKLYFN